MDELETMLTPRQAATALGVSYATVKKWILAGTLKTVTTPGGHHRIARGALAPLAREGEAGAPESKPAQKRTQSRAQSRERFRATSGRNQLVGTIVEVKIRGILAQVVLAIGEQRVTAIITADAAREMGLRKGQTAAALMKATSVMITRV